MLYDNLIHTKESDSHVSSLILFVSWTCSLKKNEDRLQVFR